MVRPSRSLAAAFFTLPLIVPAALLAPGCVSDLPAPTATTDAATAEETGASVDSGSPTADASPDSAVADATSDTTPASNDATTDAPSSSDATTDAPTSNDAGPPSLNTVVGLRLWLRADKGVQTSAGHVTGWLDQSGIANDLTPGSGSGPVVVTDGGVSALEFDGQSQLLVNPTNLGILAGQARTVVVVARPKSLTAQAQLLGQDSTKTDTDLCMVLANPYLSSPGHYGAHVNGASLQANQATSTFSFGVHVLRVNAIKSGDTIAAATSYRFNGKDSALTVVYGGTSAGAPDPNETIIGALHTSNGYVYGALDILEGAVWDHALNATETSTVEADLKARYGL